MRNLRVPIRVVFYREAGVWIAHCLEFDLMGDGSTKAEAVRRLWDAMLVQMEASLKYNNPSNLFSPADGKFFEMFAAGKDVAVGELEMDLQLPHIDSVSVNEAEMREYDDADTERALV